MHNRALETLVDAISAGDLIRFVMKWIDFEHPPKIHTDRTEAFRESIGLVPDDIMILQPTLLILHEI